MNHKSFKVLINFYPPYWATGIVVKKVSPDFRELMVQMKKRFYNRNYVNTHFGGSLYAMVDPFYMLMLIQILGKEYVVWDKSAQIDFVKPGRGTVSARFVISDELLSDIIRNTADGGKYLPELAINVTDEQGEVICRVMKTIYIRKKTTRPAYGDPGFPLSRE